MLRFNPPPGWPPVPDGWLPPPEWQPDPSWPPAPPGWPFYTDTAARGPETPAAPPRRPPGRLVALVSVAAVFLVLVTYAAVSSITGNRRHDVVVNGFAYSVKITDTASVTAVSGLIAKPGYSFIQVTVEVTNEQTDRSAPMIDGVQAIAAAPEIIRTGTPDPYTGVQGCDVEGFGAGQVSTGIAGAPAGWCFFSVVQDGTSPYGSGPLEAGASVSQTYHSSEAFPSDVDAGLFHVYGVTGRTETMRGQDLDLGKAG